MSRECPECWGEMVPVEVKGSVTVQANGKLVNESAWSVECSGGCGYLALDIEADTPEGALEEWEDYDLVRDGDRLVESF